MRTQSIEGAMPPLPEPDHYLWEHKHGDVAPQLSRNTGPHPDFEVTPLFEKYRLVALLARVAELQKDAARWRRLVNASELPFPTAAIADDPENDARMVYGRKRLEALIDLMDEIPNTYAIDAVLAAHKEQP